MDSRPSILVVDDEQRSLESIERILGDRFDVFTAINTEEAEKILQQQWIQVLLCDQRMPGMSGLELQEQLAAKGSILPVIMITAFGSVETAVTALKHGAFDYLQKPLSSPDELRMLVGRALERGRVEAVVTDFRDFAGDRHAPEGRHRTHGDACPRVCAEFTDTIA